MSHVSSSIKRARTFERFSDDKSDFRFDGEYFHSAGSSSFSHRSTYGMANYKGKALTTGCKDTRPECGVKTEIMDMHTLEWSKGPDYPFASV